MNKKVLVTGGAGFIGSFIVDELIRQGHDVRVLDAIDPQVHIDGGWPVHINPAAEYVRGDVRDEASIRNALQDIEVVFHQAAAVGVGQSMYQIHKYMDINTMGTARLLDVMVNSNIPIKKFIVASSMSIYGEGAYYDQDSGQTVFPRLRNEDHLKAGQFEHLNGHNKGLTPIPTPESKPLDSTSIYAISKKDQEEMTLTIGRTYGIPSVALRYFNVYGPRQSLSNPYTGVAAIFMSRILNDQPPLIFEDGLQSRDFTSVHDIVQANMKAMTHTSADYEAINVGTGRSLPIAEISRILAQLHKKEHIKPIIAGKYRAGDIRHCYADITKARSKLDFEPSVKFEDGMKELMRWSTTQKSKDMVQQATQELDAKGLVK